MIVGYANCTLDDEELEKIDAHLLDCVQCSERLGELVESGVGPNWLPSARTLGRKIEDQKYSAFHRSGHSSPATELIAESIPHSPVDRYQLMRRHGEGGMGEVWLGWDVVLKRQVALKQLPAGQQDEKLIRRLQQEAFSLARLAHPNIVSVFEIVARAHKRTIVMEFIDGPTLAQFRKDFVLSERVLSEWRTNRCQSTASS